ncbi:MAG: response regulator [Cyanobacteria bacterium P01_D01_bin.44]
MKVLLVEDDTALATLLSQQLTGQHYTVDRVADGETGWAYASTFEYDLIILDWMLPQLDGIQLCHRLRSQGYGVPILLLTARDEQTDKIKGLEAGADDYVVKPFDIIELLVRIRVLLRRTLTDTTPILSWGDLCLDPVSCEVTYQGYQVSLTAKEYSILELFLRHSHQVFSVSTLLDRIWSSEEFPSEATVRSHIRGLRRKLKTVGAPADLIETVHGLGYRLKTQALNPTEDSAPAASEPDRQALYLAGLTQAWDAHKGENLEHWNHLAHIAQTLKTQRLSEQKQTQAQQIAHSLAGTLGTFGLMEGYRLALQLEQLLRAETLFSTAQISQFQALVTTLGHALDEHPRLVCPTEDAIDPAKLLIVDVNDMPYVQQLMALAVAQGFETTVAASMETASQALSLGSSSLPTSELIADLPDVVLINLVAGEADPVLDEPILQMLLQFITRLTQQRPWLPMLLITPQADFGNRLDLIRRGGTVVLEYPVVPAEILEVMTQTLHHSYRHSKIMIVDDDTHYLQQVIQRLQPWNFQITPLANPQRFWTLFTQVLPDMVILDIEMPHISGFELCQVLRSHPQWQHLPIIFLSIHADQANQDQAFALGADDYITKPIQSKDLGGRLVNRLKRYQAWLRAKNWVAYEGI